MKKIDLRSDTVTRPTPQMYEAMMNAELADDVYGGDPTVGILERRAAEILRLEAAMFVPSGTQSNLIAIMTHCARGEEYLTGDQYHVNRFEGGGAAVFGSVVPGTVPVQIDGTLDLDALERQIKKADIHLAETRLISLENTFGGLALPIQYQADVQVLAKKHNLKIHLDGARLFNAAQKLGVSPAEVAAGFDSVSICLSKGLGAPVGSLLCGSRDYISKGKKWRKMLGGGMRQSGILAACGLVALNEGSKRLEEDHRRAQRLATELSEQTDMPVVYPHNQTNMVFLDVGHMQHQYLKDRLDQQDILVSGNAPRIRMVVHRDINDADIGAVVRAFRAL